MQLHWRRVEAHTRYDFRIARPGASVQGRQVLRTIVTFEHDGVTGEGEAAPTPYYGQSLDTVETVFEQARDVLRDRDPADIDSCVDGLLLQFDDQRAAVAAIDAALHDWWGKRENAPVWRLLGLDPQHTPPTSLTIGIDDLSLLPDKVAAAADFKIIKCKVGGPQEVATLQRLRELAPQHRIRVDANCGWSPNDMLARAAALEPFDLELIEQPLPAQSDDAVRQLREATRVPIIADEDSITPDDIPNLADVYDGVNVKLSKCGGMREARRMIALARQHNLSVMLGCMVETSLGVAAAAQLASLVDYVDLDGHLLLADDPYQGLLLRDGVILPSDAPGLGVHAVR